MDATCNASGDAMGGCEAWIASVTASNCDYVALPLMTDEASIVRELRIIAGALSDVAVEVCGVGVVMILVVYV
jgi:hypothetical protein